MMQRPPAVDFAVGLFILLGLAAIVFLLTQTTDFRSHSRPGPPRKKKRRHDRAEFPNQRHSRKSGEEQFEQRSSKQVVLPCIWNRSRR